MFNELFQNARRGGATRIEVTIDKNNVVVSDDGNGIETPEIVLTLGGSDWQKRTPEREPGRDGGCSHSPVKPRGASSNPDPQKAAAWTMELEPDPLRRQEDRVGSLQ